MNASGEGSWDWQRSPIFSVAASALLAAPALVLSVADVLSVWLPHGIAGSVAVAATLLGAMSTVPLLHGLWLWARARVVAESRGVLRLSAVLSLAGIVATFGYLLPRLLR